MNLENLNPWWTNRESINEDDKLIEFKNKKYKYYFPILEFEFKKDNIYSIRGPRQLGKTTAVKLVIQKLLIKKKINCFSVFFWSCEDIDDYKELIELIKEYIEITKEKGLTESYIFLDEVSFVKEWQRGVKLLIERGFLKGCCLIITGSNVIDIKTSFERLPGRKGKHTKDFELLPLNFYEFCKLLGFETRIENYRDLQIHNDKLKNYFKKYVKTGGFPLVINETFNQKISAWVKDIYYSWVIGDMLRYGKSEKITLQILSSLIRKQPSLLSWDSLAKDAEVKSHLTISSYLEALENMFVLKVNYFYDLNKKMPNSNKNKKIHFLDPFIYHIFSEKTKQKKKTDVMYEDIVCFHIYKQLREIFYTEKKKETDFLVLFGNEIIGFEVKCQEKINNTDFSSLKFLKKGFLITKDYFQIRKSVGKEHIAIPIHWFLYLKIDDLLKISKT